MDLGGANTKRVNRWIPRRCLRAGQVNFVSRSSGNNLAIEIGQPTLMFGECYGDLARCRAARYTAPPGPE